MGDLGVGSLKAWTGKASATIVYDSTVDEFTHDGLFDKVKGKGDIALIGFTADGDVFGGFYSVAVTRQSREFYDPSIFAFSFESHGRCHTPQRFAVKQVLKDKAFVKFVKGSSYGFICFEVYGAGHFLLGNGSSRSNCNSVSTAFEGLSDTTLTGQNNPGMFDNRQYHHCTRLVAVQFS